MLEYVRTLVPSQTLFSRSLLLARTSIAPALLAPVLMAGVALRLQPLRSRSGTGRTFRLASAARADRADSRAVGPDSPPSKNRYMAVHSLSSLGESLHHRAGRHADPPRHRRRRQPQQSRRRRHPAPSRQPAARTSISAPAISASRSTPFPRPPGPTAVSSRSKRLTTPLPAPVPRCAETWRRRCSRSATWASWCTSGATPATLALDPFAMLLKHRESSIWSRLSLYLRGSSITISGAIFITVG